MGIIVISGIDGSGKTSIIDIIQEELLKQGIKPRYAWLRYNHYLTKLLLAFCRFAKYTRYKHFKKSRVVYHDFHQSKLISYMFVWSTYIDTFFASIIKVYIPLCFSNRVIICDRWIYDIMVDLEVDTKLNFNSGSFFNRLYKNLLPKNVNYFLIMRSFELVKTTRDESINDDNFSIRYKYYQRHANDPELNVINNDGTIEDSVKQVMGKIDDEFTIR